MRNNRHKIIVLIFGLMIGLASWEAWFKLHKGIKHTIQVGIGSVPYSADPLEYDSFIHHITLRSIFSSLVSTYKAGEISGDIAESWEQSNQFRMWKFKISTKRRFENNDLITPEIIVKSFKRAFYVMKLKKSLSGLAENIQGIESFKLMSDVIPGLNYTNDSIVFQLKNSDPNFLAKVSFGLYGIVSPGDYDPKSGKWKDVRSGVSSGFYRISKWTDKEFSISLRSDNDPDKLLKRPIENVRFFVPANIDEFNTTDISHGSSESMLFDEGYSYVGPVNQTIRYILCGGWRDPKSLCFKIKNRRALRSLFYEELRKDKLKIVKSFFPLSISGVVENKDLDVDSIQIDLRGVREKLFVTPTKVPLKSKTKINLPTYIESFQRFNNHLAELNYFDLISSSWDSSYSVSSLNSYDIGIYFTGILVENPMEDVRFMFQSKHGIQLPDLNGEINLELKNNAISIQKINELMWEQAIVWPVNHLSLGIWVRDSSGISAQNLNKSLPPMDFRWIEWSE